MAWIYEQILKQRRDMTDWLIHFTRDSGASAARDILKNILTEGVLRPGFAPRGYSQRKTIYGPEPAVCFTEQPIASFLEYLSARNEPTAMAGYGLLIHKHDVYVAGGLPVIYGSSAARELAPGEPGYDSERRYLREEQLPRSQQYRYVTFAPTRDWHPIDWTHEREWRWPANETVLRSTGLFSLGVPFSRSDRGMFECRVHAFVDRDSDVGWLQNELQQTRAAGATGLPNEPAAEDYTAFWNQRLPKVQIISLETARRELAAGRVEFSRFEEWPTSRKYALVT